MDEFENRLRTLLNEQVDHELRDRRTVPPLRAERPATSRRRGRRAAPWLMPLVAAACVAGVVLGGVGISQLVAHRSEAPATSGPRPTHGSSTTTSPSPSPTSSGQRGTVELDGARIAVPTGWTVTAEAGFDSSVRSWCLHPSTVSVDDCTLTVSHVTTYHPAAGDTADTVNPSSIGVTGDPSDTTPCHNQVPPTQTTYRYTTFGGRSALRAEFVRPCDGRQLTHYVQYTAASAPLWFVVLGARSGPLPSGGLAALATVVGRSSLPAQDGPLPVVSVAQVRTVTRISSTVARVTLREIVEKDDPIAIALYGPTYTCDLPLAKHTLPKVGDRLYLRSDGHRVTQWLVR